nr:MAG TPA: hypothetical protein [Caudoviricetes sp.]
MLYAVLDMANRFTPRSYRYIIMAEKTRKFR